MRISRSRVFAAALISTAFSFAIGCSALTSFGDLEGTPSPDASIDGKASLSQDASVADVAADAADAVATLSYPDGASVFSGNGHAYQIVVAGGAISWEEANAIAMDAGGHLATMTTVDENAFVLGMVENTPNALYGDVGVWFGALQPDPTPAEEPDGGWAWVTGEPWSFTAWLASEPNNDGNENWGCFEEGNNGNYGWNDCNDNDSDMKSYIVEFE